MRIHQAILAAAATVGLCLAQQAPTPRPDEVKQDAANVKGVFGAIKDIKKGNKVVISVDNGKDRTYSLTDAKVTVSLAEDLAVGDKVKVIESATRGGKSVQIVRDVRDESGQERARTADEPKK
jgi:hypothetical protein